MRITDEAVQAALDAYCDCYYDGELDPMRAALLAALPYMYDQALEEAARNIIDNRSSTFKARNGKRCSIKDENGEQCWIVSFEDMDDLEIAIKSKSVPQKGGDA